MRTGGTILALLCVFALALGLRSRWGYLDRSAKLRWIAAAAIGVLSRSLTDALRWELASSRFNDLLIWARISGYILLVVLFTRLRPRRVTIPAAIVLLLPLFSATVYLPLQFVFDPSPRRLTPIGGRVFLEQSPWQREGNENIAVDYTISRRSRWVPFLQHTYRAGRLYRTQCDTDALTATLASDTMVILHCPSGAPGEPPLDEEISLRGDRDRNPAPVIPSKP